MPRSRPAWSIASPPRCPVPLPRDHRTLHAMDDRGPLLRGKDRDHQMTKTDNHAAAQAVHDLGSALWFGGTVMGVAGVNKSGADLQQGIDRIRVAASAWQRFAPAQWAGIAATLGAGLQLTRVGGRRIALQKGFGTIGALKAALTVAGAAATAYAAYSGSKIGRIAEQTEISGEKLEVRDATQPTSETPPELATWQRRQ